MRMSMLSLALIAPGLIPNPAWAEFSGTFELAPAGCQQQGQCTLSFDFRYLDPNGLAWQAAAQNQTDGASIPKWAQSFVGDPFDPSYIKAAVIHDHYCDRHVRSWRATHRVFYDALRELGVSATKAKLMYYAVYLGGPKWVELIPGKSCGANNCVFDVEVSGASAENRMEFKVEGVFGGAAEMRLPGIGDTGGAMIISRGAQYDEPGFVEELKSVEKIPEDQGDDVDLDALERRAREKRPNDFFYENQSQIQLGGELSLK